MKFFVVALGQSGHSLWTMNIPLLLEIKEKFLEEPKRCSMDQWLTLDAKWKYPPEFVPECNTIGCIAGWAVQLSQRTREVEASSGGGVRAMAIKVLDISLPDSEFLFFISRWPDFLGGQYNELSADARGAYYTMPQGEERSKKIDQDLKQMADITCKAIDAFIDKFASEDEKRMMQRAASEGQV